MPRLTARQRAALTAAANAEATIRPGNPHYVSERREPAGWDTHDMTALVTAGYVRDGGDYVLLTRAGQREVTGR